MVVEAVKNPKHVGRTILYAFCSKSMLLWFTPQIYCQGSLAKERWSTLQHLQRKHRSYKKLKTNLDLLLIYVSIFVDMSFLCILDMNLNIMHYYFYERNDCYYRFEFNQVFIKHIIIVLHSQSCLIGMWPHLCSNLCGGWCAWLHHYHGDHMWGREVGKIKLRKERKWLPKIFYSSMWWTNNVSWLY